MARVTVVNVRGQDPAKWLDPANWPHNTVRVYVGRRCGGWPASALGNPFRIGQGMTREQAIQAYREYILSCCRRPGARQRQAMLDLARAYRDGKAIELGCWCAPEPCHGDVLAMAIPRIAERL